VIVAVGAVALSFQSPTAERYISAGIRKLSSGERGLDGWTSDCEVDHAQEGERDRENERTHWG